MDIYDGADWTEMDIDDLRAGRVPASAGRISFTGKTGREFDSPRSLENEREAAN
jgi:hypothetical protein